MKLPSLPKVRGSFGRRHTLLVVVFIVVAFGTYFLDLSATGALTAPVPDDFAFRYSYGNGSILDTRNDLYVKDMLCEHDLSSRVVLSQEDRQTIYSALMKNDFWSMKEDMSFRCRPDGSWCNDVEVKETTVLTATARGATRTVKHTNNYALPDDPDVQRLYAIEGAIRAVILAKEQALGIVEPKC